MSLLNLIEKTVKEISEKGKPALETLAKKVPSSVKKVGTIAEKGAELAEKTGVKRIAKGVASLAENPFISYPAGTVLWVLTNPTKTNAPDEMYKYDVKEQKKDIKKLAELGFQPKEIAAIIEAQKNLYEDPEYQLAAQYSKKGGYEYRLSRYLEELFKTAQKYHLNFNELQKKLFGKVFYEYDEVPKPVAFPIPDVPEKKAQTVRVTEEENYPTVKLPEIEVVDTKIKGKKPKEVVTKKVGIKQTEQEPQIEKVEHAVKETPTMHEEKVQKTEATLPQNEFQQYINQLDAINKQRKEIMDRIDNLIKDTDEKLREYYDEYEKKMEKVLNQKMPDAPTYQDVMKVHNGLEALTRFIIPAIVTIVAMLHPGDYGENIVAVDKMWQAIRNNDLQRYKFALQDWQNQLKKFEYEVEKGKAEADLILQRAKFEEGLSNRELKLLENKLKMYNDMQEQALNRLKLFNNLWNMWYNILWKNQYLDVLKTNALLKGKGLELREKELGIKAADVASKAKYREERLKLLEQQLKERAKYHGLRLELDKFKAILRHAKDPYQRIEILTRALHALESGQHPVGNFLQFLQNMSQQQPQQNQVNSVPGGTNQQAESSDIKNLLKEMIYGELFKTLKEIKKQR